MTTLTNKMRLTLGGLFSLAIALVLCSVFAQNALATTTLVYEPGVTDDVTRVEVAKLNKADHSFVKGATMAICDEQNNVLFQWVTDGSSKLIEGGKNINLNVDTVYILREIAAPDGYATAKDTKFVILPSEEEGIQILGEHPDSELTPPYKITVYDEQLPAEKEIIQHQKAPKTGDDTPLGLAVAIGTIAVIGVIVLQVVKVRNKAREQK